MRPNLQEDVLSLSEFKRNSAAMMRRLHRTRRPLVLTVNGRATAVVQNPGEYEKAQARLEHEDTVAGIRAGLADMKAGRHISLDDFLVKMRETVRG
jgi:prevent-host-death family protein